MNQEELEFWQQVEQLTAIPQQPDTEYRLYYNEEGEITHCTNTATEPTADLFLTVSEQEYNDYYLYKVVKGQLKKIAQDAGYVVQLEKSTSGYKVVRGHASLLLEDKEVYPDTEYYGRTNN